MLLSEKETTNRWWFCSKLRKNLHLEFAIVLNLKRWAQRSHSATLWGALVATEPSLILRTWNPEVYADTMIALPKFFWKQRLLPSANLQYVRVATLQALIILLDKRNKYWYGKRRFISAKQRNFDLLQTVKWHLGWKPTNKKIPRKLTGRFTPRHKAE